MFAGQSLPLVLLLLLGMIGWVISLYFRLVHREIISDRVIWMPRFLQMNDCRCEEIVDTRFGQTLGRSNAWWGLWYYPLLELLLLGNWLFGIPGIGTIFIVALLAFAYSVYLAWGLFILRVLCRPCLGAHLVNAAIFLILLTQTYPLFFTR